MSHNLMQRAITCSHLMAHSSSTVVRDFPEGPGKARLNSRQRQPPARRLRQPPRRPRAPLARAKAFSTTSGLRSEEHQGPAIPSLPYRFETGIALFAKRAPRPFPPPFLSRPSNSFSDALSTHDHSRDRRARVNGEIILGKTNGDDAVYASDYFICANDGVGAWSTRPRGHAGLWSRLILHFWASALRDDLAKLQSAEDKYEPNPVAFLQQAYDNTIKATAEPANWQGTTTASGAQLHFKTLEDGKMNPVVYVTNLGDCQVMVLRPKDEKVIYKTKEQWHWFDCPRQLGTNSPDTPEKNAVMDKVEVRVGDVILAMSDGVIDNMWEHEIVHSVRNSLERWENGEGGKVEGDRTDGANGGMKFAAEELVTAAKVVALDPFAESPFMEHAIEEGLASTGGKLDDISVVAALVTDNDTYHKCTVGHQQNAILESHICVVASPVPFEAWRGFSCGGVGPALTLTSWFVVKALILSRQRKKVRLRQPTFTTQAPVPLPAPSNTTVNHITDRHSERPQPAPYSLKMRGKRSKQYRKLMTQYSQIWGFREPYQCLIDAEMVIDCHKFKYDLVAGLKRTLHGEVKPMISQCEIRKLYLRKAEPEMNTIIEFAKTLDRRRCGHLPEDYPEPLPTNECFKAVVDPKGKNVNKHKLVVVCQDDEVRRMLRSIPGVPQIYIKRSVMILEPMASESAEIRAREEKSKYRAGLKGSAPPGAKRKREADDEGDQDGDGKEAKDSDATDAKKKKKKAYGKKEPNPLAVKKAKDASKNAKQGSEPEKKKRKRKHKAPAAEGQAGEDGEAQEPAPAPAPAPVKEKA
ncbi:rRNA-processing protein UTP23 [Verticillium dahliae VdLs.17]|uniref:U three protein 23 n=1 Tax=Verticillium dahliae (strain VdLs.17 / ATCC MYA-4575 / FGSC 10137) TaxID=498257 RepID=G2WZ17_VERDV|nr:rRNA-processing protein UTP23 [Verticillium dahliae VdLs.17]EGY21819.1 rRNA-processing protein UTP23 [Verticillium dahliae VdLs.17]KAH6703654.1 rRNA-processing protein UTP23 [Verticillium dahliae]